MGRDVAYLICAVIVMFRIIKTCIMVVNRDRINSVVDDVISDIALLVTFFIYFSGSEHFTRANYYILNKYLGETQANSFLVRIIFEILFFLLIRWIINWILKFIQDNIFRDGFESITNNRAISMATGIIMGFLKGCITLIVVFVFITIINNFMPSSFRVSVFDDVKAFKTIESFLDSNVSIKDYPTLLSRNTNKGVTYYNGIRIEDGVKSNEDIDRKARELTKGATSDRDKAKILYSYVGAHIQYDYDKAERVNLNDFSTNSGAVEGFYQGSGICLDYACLYTAMAMALDMKVRVVVGDMYDRGEWIGHAWNEIYLEDEDKWIVVDPTNYAGGNYFDNADVERNYKREDVAFEG